jgi:hypothetical protein
MTRAPGKAWRTPRAIAAAALSAERDPLKESGHMKMDGPGFIPDGVGGMRMLCSKRISKPGFKPFAGMLY